MPQSSIGAHRLLLWVIFPVVAVYTFAVAIRYRCVRYLLQRFGYFSHHPQKTSPTSHPLWFHCASVGETNTALPLIRAWLAQNPHDLVVITSNTITANQLLKKQLPANVTHYYLPLDYPSSCRRFLAALQPRCSFIMETEIWLSLFTECRKMKIPVFIINARLAERTMTQRRWLGNYYRKSLAAVEHIYARSQHDADAYHTLGADAEKISTVGNLKYAAKFPQQQTALITRDYILAASTHENEELQIAAAWKYAQIKQLLVIVPRHPERGKAIIRQLRKAKYTHLQLRSKQPLLHKNTKIYIADTIGELPQWIAHAKLVFTGGSLIDIGGHNVLEPAILGTPQITGPFTKNFAAEVHALKENGGIEIVADQHALRQTLQAFSQHPEPYQAMANNATQHLQQHQNILEEYLVILNST